MSHATLLTPLAAIKGFLDYHETSMNWKRIKSVLPAVRKGTLDSAPTTEEIRQLLAVCDQRMRVVVLILASSGMRTPAAFGPQPVYQGPSTQLRSSVFELEIHYILFLFHLFETDLQGQAEIMRIMVQSTIWCYWNP